VSVLTAKPAPDPADAAAWLAASPLDAANWVSPAPSTLSEAINRISSAVVALQGGSPIA